MRNVKKILDCCSKPCIVHVLCLLPLFAFYFFFFFFFFFFFLLLLLLSLLLLFMTISIIPQVKILHRKKVPGEGLCYEKAWWFLIFVPNSVVIAFFPPLVFLSFYMCISAILLTCNLLSFNGDVSWLHGPASSYGYSR